MPNGFRYKAFLSYSHVDKKWGEWLHKQLERYRIPKSLSPVGEDGKIQRTIGRIFRDRDELAAAEDLTEEVRKALLTSEYMIVLCSPEAAASTWVNKEIIEFKQLRGDKYVLPVILSGEPFSTGGPTPEDECFPPAVRFKLLNGKSLSTVAAEPSAADMREGTDGKKRAVMKLIAGMLGVGLDQLIERDLRRRHKRVMAITAGSVLGMVAMGFLTLEAYTAREAAERNRNEAEDLVEFMLTDLREKLEPVGRLDVLDAVAERVLEHHKKQAQYGTLSDDDLGRQSRAYHMMGEMQYRRSEMDAAQQMFEEALTATGELLRRDPENTQRIFEHAQSVYWAGNRDLVEGNLVEAEISAREYMNLAKQLVALEPEIVDWQIELAYGHNNMAFLFSRHLNQPIAALPHTEKALTLFRQTSAARPESNYLKTWVATQYTDLGRIYIRVGHVDDVDLQWNLAKKILNSMYAEDTRDQQVLERLVVWYTNMGAQYATRGRFDKSIDSYNRAIELVDVQLLLESENTRWQEHKIQAEYYLAEAYIKNGHLDDAREHYKEAEQTEKRLNSQGQNKSLVAEELRILGLRTLLYIDISSHGVGDAISDIDAAMIQVLSRVEDLQKTPRGRWFLASFYQLKIRSLFFQGDIESASKLFEELSTYINAQNTNQMPQILIVLRDILSLLGRVEDSSAIQHVLQERGYIRTTPLSEKTDTLIH